MIRSPAFTKNFRILGLPEHDIKEMFQLIDTDKDGTLTIEEFIWGVKRMKGAAKGKDLVKMLSFLKSTKRKVTKLTSRVDRMMDTLDLSMSRLDRMCEVTDMELDQREVAYRRQDELQASIRDKKLILDHLEEKQTKHFPGLASSDSRVARRASKAQARLF